MKKRVHYSIARELGLNKVSNTYDETTKTIEVVIDDNIWNLMVQATCDVDTMKAIYREKYAGNPAALAKVEALTEEQVAYAQSVNAESLLKYNKAYTIENIKKIMA